MKTLFNKGSELDKQIYKEGETTWGCKSGVLDVEDVKQFIKDAHDDLKKVWCSGFVSLSEDCFEREWNKMLKERAGNKLIEEKEISYEKG
ncbi:MAG: hypothetical protein ACP5D2_05350 [Candidatus Nanoarchaeia archaeon]